MERLRTREEIVKESPLLRAFIDPFVNTDFEMWRKMLNKVFKSKGQEVLLTLDKEIAQKEINTLFNLKDAAPVFTSRADESLIGEYFVILALIGMEVGDRNEVKAFVGEIMNPFIKMDIIYDNKEARMCTVEALECGVGWKERIDQSVPEGIRNSISKLDMGALD